MIQNPKSNDLKIYQQIPCQTVNFSNYLKPKDYSEFEGNSNRIKLPIFLTVAYFSKQSSHQTVGSKQIQIAGEIKVEDKAKIAAGPIKIP